MEDFPLKLFRSPVDALRDTPITSTMLVLIAAYSWWLGYILVHSAAKLPRERQLGYRGPLSLCGLSTWGHLFIAAGVLIAARLFIHADHRRLSMALHMVGMMVSMAWAISFDLGPVTTGQAAYTFEAVVIFGTPFTVGVIERRYGRARPSLG
jgi:hypothetical protein